MPVEPRLQTIIEQLQTILVLLERPTVQYQLEALLLAILLAWLLSRGWHRLNRRYLSPATGEEAAQKGNWLRRLMALEHLYFPLFAIILVQVATSFLMAQGESVGLLENIGFLFWLWTGYGLFITLLYASFGEQKVQLYHQRIFAPLFVWIVAAGLLANLIDLNLLSQIVVVTILNTPITLGGIFLALIVFYFFLVITWVMQDVLLRVVMPRINAEVGVVESIQTISNYVILSIGMIISTSTLGFDLSTLAFIGGGLTIALGFGLQQILANFISGILLLFEQALRPGDVIQINGQMGTVEQLRIRSTLVRTLDNVEIIVPNEKLLTSAVTTYTKSDRLIRISLPVGVGYDSKPKEVRQILLAIAAQYENVLPEPAPVVLFSGLGESSLDFQLLVWLNEPSQIARIRSDLYFLLWDAFAEHQIEIPFPQRDLNLRRGWEQVATGLATRTDIEQMESKTQ